MLITLNINLKKYTFKVNISLTDTLNFKSSRQIGHNDIFLRKRKNHYL